MLCRVLLSLALLAVAYPAAAADEKLPTYTDPADAGPDYAIQGEYLGEIQTDEGAVKLGVQVVALGEGKFSATALHGGLPGAGWKKGDKRDVHPGTAKNGQVVFQGDGGSGTLADGKLTITDGSGKKLGVLDRVERQSETIGAKPPAGAVVLFDGSSAEHFANGQMTDDGLLMAGTRTSESFGSCTLHLEFQTPFMPTATGQARGNSGVYLADLYEIQVLDSFGLEGKNNECGGIYSLEEPLVNMCLPPLTWQTYDIEFTAARYTGDKKTANARVTVLHNGVPVYQDFEIPKFTPGGAAAEGPVGALQLQAHGNPVRYRNIWLVKKS